MKRRLKGILIAILTFGIFFTFGGDAQAGTDVFTGLGGFEPHAAVVNPLIPNNVIVSQGTNLVISNDFGATFPIVVNTANVPAGYGGCGDDVLAFDALGNLWWSYLRCKDNAPVGNFFSAEDDISVVVQQVTPTTGALVGLAVDLTPGLHSDDKQWIAADSNPASPFANNVYVHWTRFDNSPREEFFSRCVNCATTNTFSAPSNIATGGGEGFRHQSNIAVAPNGDVYASYHSFTCGNDETDGDIILMRDSNGGADFAAGGNPPANVFKTSVFGSGGAEVTCNRQPSTSTVPKAHFLMQGAAAPFVIADPVRPGNIYVIANDDPDNDAGTGDDGDVLLARSTDYGVSFTISRIDHAPQGPNSLQVFPQGAIDPDGNLVVFWYDTRRQLNNNGPDGAPGTPDDYWNLDVYATVSRDGAQTFSNDFRINDVPFDPELGAPNFQGDNPPTFRIGEYNGIGAVDGLGYAAWTGNNGANQDIVFDLFSIQGVFPDPLEPNESTDFAVVAALGADDTYNQPDLTLHSATDVDFFKIIALHSGKLEVEIEFNELVADLEVLVQDVAENTIATGTMTTIQTGSSVEMLAIAVVQGETYFVEVFNPNALNTFPPQSSYDLTIVNRSAPVPFGLDLVASSDSGRDNSDNETNDSTPTIRMNVDTVDAADMGIDLLDPSEVAAGEDGYAVAVFRSGNLVGYAAPVPGTNSTIWEITPSVPFTDGAHSITAKVEVFDRATPQVSGFGGESQALLVVIDTTSPAAPSIPDLLASSDSAGIDDDNITTITTPAFVGIGEANALVRIEASGALVGQGVVTSGGDYEITVEPLADEVYDIAAELEDLAGNVSALSTPLKVTIANQVLNLHGDTAGPANINVRVDLSLGTVAGYPGVAGATGNVGIVGIPTVNLDVNVQALTIWGTPGDDDLQYTPTQVNGGNVTRAGSTQVINFTNAGTFTIDPLGGADTLTVNGTSLPDDVTVVGNVTTTVQVNGRQQVDIPMANLERLVIETGQGVDNIDVTTFDSLNASIFVNAGEPTTNRPNGDSLTVFDGSGKAKIRNQPGGPVPNSGSVLVEYARTTGNITRIDYANVEKFSKGR